MSFKRFFIRTACLATIFLAALLISSVDNASALTSLIFQQVSKNNEQGITGMVNPLSAVVSPDGKHIIVTGHSSTSIAVFNRDTSTNLLTFNNSISGVTGLGEPNGVAISPDGNHVYVAVFETNSLITFDRNSTTGALTHKDTITPAETSGTNSDSKYFKPIWAALSTDGKFVYIVSNGAPTEADASVSVFSRDPATGLLTIVETVYKGQAITGGTISDIQGALFLTISPDGKNIYVAGSRDDAIGVFGRDAVSGRLSWVESIKDDATTGLDQNYGIILNSASTMLYAVGFRDNAVSAYSRDTVTGALAWVQTLTNGSTDELGNTVDGLSGPLGVGISADNRYLYTAGRRGNSLAVFDINSSTGKLTFNEALFDDEPDAAGQTIDGLSGATVVLPAGSAVYTLGYVDNAIALFSRASSGMSLTPVSLDFGWTLLNKASTPGTVTMTNTGALNITIKNISISGDFSQTNNCPTVLPPADSCTFDVTFTPKALGLQRSSLAIETNLSATASVVTLAGTGVTSLTPTAVPTILYGHMDVLLDGAVFPAQASSGNISTWTFSIYNIGDGNTIGLTFKAQLGNGLIFAGASTSQGTSAMTNEGFVWDVGVIPDSGVASVSIDTELTAGSSLPGQVCILGSVIKEAKEVCQPVSVQAAVPTLIPTAIQTGPTPTQDLFAQTYVVQQGDTLFSIARRFGSTVDALAALNNLADPTSIQAGQVLQLRPTQPPPDTPALPTSTFLPSSSNNAVTITPAPPTPTPVPATPLSPTPETATEDQLSSGLILILFGLVGAAGVTLLGIAGIMWWRSRG